MANPKIFLDVLAEAKSLGTFKSQLKDLVKEPLTVKIELDKDSQSRIQKQLKDIADAASKSGNGSGGNALKNTEAQLLKIEALQAKIATQMAKASIVGMVDHDAVQAISRAASALDDLQKRVENNSVKSKEFNSVIADAQSKLSSATTMIQFYADANKEVVTAAEESAKAVQDLNKELKAIEDMRGSLNSKIRLAESLGLDADLITNMRGLVTELDNLELALRNGQIDSTEYATAMSSLKLRVSESTNAFNAAKDAMNAEAKANKEAAAAAKEHAKASKEDADANNTRSGALKKVGDELKSLVARYVSVQQLVRLIREMAKASIELDSAFTQLKIVTGATESEMAKFEKTAYKLAKSLGQSATDVTKSIEVFSRLGYDLADASKLAEYAGILSNVADVSSNEATTGLTSIIKGFNMQVSNAEHVSDVLIQVGQKYAVSAGEIMTAFEKSSAALNATGVSFEKAAGLIAAANASVQDANTVGTALKTVSARVRASKADLEELGEDVGELAQGFSTYAKEIEALTGVNIMVEGTTDQFKDLYDIMAEISNVWDTLTDTQQSRVSEILGGKRQLQVISSILGNWKDAVGAYEDAMNSAGVATQANATYMDSAAAHINQLKATFQEFAAHTLDSDMIKWFIDLGTAAISLADKLGGLKTILLSFGTIKAFAMGGGVAGGIMAGITGIVAIVSAIKQHREALAQANRDAAEAAASESDELAALAAEYTSINEQVSKSEADKKRLSEIESELINKYGIEKRELSELTDLYGNLGDAIKKVTTRELGQRLADLERGIAQYKSDLLDTASTGSNKWYREAYDLSGLIVEGTAGNGEWQSAYNAISGLKSMGLVDHIYGNESMSNFGFDIGSVETVEDIIDAYERLGKAMDWVGDQYGYSNVVYAELSRVYNELKPSVEAYTSAIEDNNRVLAEKAAIEQLQGETLPKTKEAFDEYRQKIIDTVAASDAFITSQGDQAGKVKEVESVVDEYLQTLSEFSDFYGDEQTLPPSAKQTQEQVRELTNLSEALAKLKTDYDILAKAEEEMKDGGGLSPDTIKALSDATDDYLDYLYEENGVVKMNTEAWNNMIDAQRQDTTESIRRNIEVLKQQRVELENTLNEIMYTSAHKDQDMEVVQRQLDANAHALAENIAALEVYEAAMSAVATATAEAADETQKLSDFLSETSSGLTSLADLQAAVSESYRISVSEAMKYAEVFPEILAQSQLTADGQIQLNQAVVDSFIQSSQAEINAAIEKKIAELEAEKEVLEAKKAYAEAKLQIVKAAGEAEGEVAYQTAQYRLQVADELVAKLIEEGNEESEAYAQVAESMATNIEEFDSVVAEVADDMQHNLGEAADNAATSISNNMSNASESVRTLGKQIHEAARQMNALRNGQLVEYTDTGTSGAGGAGYHTSNMRVKSHSFKGTVVSKSKKDLALDTLTIDLENTISGYEDEIAKIDGSIANLRNILNSSLDKFASGSGSGRSGSGSGGGGGSKSGGSTSADVQKVDQEVIKGYESLISQYQKAIQVTQSYLDQAIATNDITGVQEHTQKIIDYYRQMQETVHDEAEYYRSLGYDETSDEIQKLKDLWWDYAENIGTVTAEAYQKLADNAKSSLDEIRSAYDTLKSAAQEYAESGFITINTLESIISMGVQYLGFLYDENGQLVINEQSIQRVIAARTEQYAVESALAYVAQVRQAAEAGDITTLNQLTQATQISTGATWDLVYAQMALINLSDEQYNGMLRNVQALQSLTTSAISSIGQQTGQVRQQLQDQQNGLNKIMDATKSMIRQENQAQINATKQAYQAQINATKEAGNAQVEALRNQKKAYDDQIDQKKKLLDATQKQIDKEDTLAGKVQKIAKLQAKITQLSLDDSREAKAERTKLEEELADLQKDLTDTQRKYEVEAQKDALDEQKSAYDKAMDAQISAAQKAADAAVSAMQASMDQQVSILQNSLNSEEKLYQAALSRIDGGWDSLYGDLKAWNAEYGNMVESDLVSAWDAASAAVQRYGSYAAAVTGVQNEINGLGNSNTVGTSNAYGSSQINATSVRAVINQMRANSEKWKTAASQAEKDRLHEDTVKLAQNLSRFGVRVHYEGSSGKWIIDSDTNNPSNVGRWLYEVYHKGGIVGQTPTLQQNETMAKLQNGEMVLTQDQSGVLYKIVDFVSVLSDKLGKILDSSAISRLFDGSDNSALASMLRNSAAGTGAMPGVGNITVEHMEVSAPIHVVQKLDDDDIREHAKAIGSFAAEYIKEGFTKRGVKATASLLG